MLRRVKVTSEYTFSNSVITKAVKVIVMIFVNGSLKKIKVESIIMQP